MAVQKQNEIAMDCKPTATGHDLTGKERRCAARDASGNFRLAQLGEVVAGVIQEGKIAGKSSTVMTGGMAKCIAGGAITPGQAVQSGGDGVVIAGATNSFGTSRNSAFSGEMVEVWMDKT
jgi:hypothetical protein